LNQTRFVQCLSGASDYPGHAHGGLFVTPIGLIHLLDGQFQERSKQTKTRIADGKLRGVDADSQSAGAGSEIITEERPLAALVPAPIRGQSQRTSGDD
jgi:hypothetical protein